MWTYSDFLSVVLLTNYIYVTQTALLRLLSHKGHIESHKSNVNGFSLVHPALFNVQIVDSYEIYVT